jgi:hypothetical protein
MRISSLFLLLILGHFLNAQSSGDTLNRYGGGRFLLQQNGRYELKQGDSLLSYWDKMDEVLTLDYKGYQVIQRKAGEKWVKGLFRRNEGKLFLQPEYEIVNNFFYFPDLVYVKGPAGCSIFSVITGKKTREGYSNFRKMANKYCLGYNDWGMFVYNKELELTDSIAGLRFEGRQTEYGVKELLFLGYKDGFALVDDQFRMSIHPGWKNINRLMGNLLVIETAAGQGVYNISSKKMLTTADFDPFSYEMHEDRFTLRKNGEYYLFDSTGRQLARVKGGGLACVDDLKAFFYEQNGAWGIMNAAGKILQSPAFVDFNQSTPPIGFFLARKKDESVTQRYAWVYTMIKDRKTITGIKHLGPWKETDPYPVAWPPNQPVDMKQN